MSGWILLGHVSGLHGVRGWVKVFSHTQPREGIANYNPLYLNVQGGWRPLQVEEACLQGKGVIVKFADFTDRDSAASLVGSDIAIRREQLPALGCDEYYWADLQGLRVVTVDGVELGTVSHLLETGANDVVVVKGERERLLPFLRGEVIVAVDLEQGVMQVAWDPDF